MKIVIGLVGEKGAGKGTFIKILSRIVEPKTFEKVSSGEFLQGLAEILHIEATRKNLQDLAVTLDSKFGKGTLANVMSSKIEESTAEIVVYDSVRWLSDLAMIRAFERNYLVYVTADLKTRWERTLARGEKIGESGALFEQFQQEEGAENEIYIEEISKSADFKIVNNGSEKEFKEAAKKFFDSINKK